MAQKVSFDAYLGWVNITNPNQIPADARVIGANDLLRYEKLGKDVAAKFTELDAIVEGWKSDSIISELIDDATSETRYAVGNMVKAGVADGVAKFQKAIDDIPNKVDAQVAPMVAKAIAADRTVADAAAAAVTQQIAGRSLVESTDPRLPEIGDDEAFRIQNRDGGIPFRVEGDSTWVGNTEFVPDDEHWRFLSLNKRILMDIDPVSGEVYVPNLRVDAIASPAGGGGGGGGGTAVTRVVLVLGAGQSNMRGKAQPYGAGLDFPDPSIKMWHWGNKQLTTATVPLSGPTTTSTDGYGPLNEIAKQTRRTEPEGTAVVVLNAAVGNTTLVGESTAGTWPIDYTGPVPHLYEQMTTEIPKVIEAIRAHYGVAPEIRFYWHQGEADAGATATYTTKFTALVNDLRSRLGLPEMPVVLGGLVPEYITANPNREGIRAAHVQIPATLACSAYVDGIPNSGGSSSITDIVHYHREGAEALGAAMYAATRRAVVNRPKSVPVPVTNVRAMLAGGTLTVNWDQPLCAVTGYTVEYSTNAGSTWTTITRPLGLETSARAAVSGSSAQVRISTVNATGTSAPSTPVTATLGA